jgi:type IV fimbrial biogenesis protein FimT
MRRRDSSRPARLRDQRNQRGLTAIELMVTLAILAILVGLAAPSMSRFIVQWRLSNAVNALTGSLRIARTEAIARARPVVVCQLKATTAVACETGASADELAGGWIVFVDNDRDASSVYSELKGDELLLRQNALPGLSHIKLGNPGRFVFLPNGLTRSANSIKFEANGFNTADTTPWAQRTLCLSKPGRIRRVSDAADCSGNEE